MLAVVSNGPALNAGRARPARGTACPSGLCGSELCCEAELCSGTSAAAAWTLARYVPLSGTNAFVGKQQGTDTDASWCSPRVYTAPSSQHHWSLLFLSGHGKAATAGGNLGALAFNLGNLGALAFNLKYLQAVSTSPACRCPSSRLPPRVQARL